jgi:endonuclease/exonuclease/phosphatase (EEP) superfamily protein YafD
VWLVVVGLLTVVAAHIAAYDHDHLFFLANSYSLWILLPAYPIAVAALCFRTWPLAIAALFVVVAHLAWVVPPTLHTVTVPAAAAHAPHLRIASANVRYDNLVHRPLLAELQRADADIIVMEEVTPAWWKAIATSSLLRTHPDVARAVRPDPGGMVVLSRHPLTHVVVHHAGGWPIITATVEVGGRPVHLAGVHLVAPLETFERNQRAERRITLIARHLARPRVVVGDFNASPYNRWFHQLLDLGLRDAHESVGRPFATTWPNGLHLVPPLLLDHLFADPSIIPLAVREGRGEGSDHRPIVVDLAVTP